MKHRHVGLALLCAACGDPIADGSYLGEPLLRIEGRIAGDAGTSDIRNPFVAISWWNLDETQMELLTTAAPIAREHFTGAVSIDLYDPPPADAFMRLGPTRFAVGVPVALDDVDGDGVFRVDSSGRIVPPDRIFGVATDGRGLHVAVFIDEPGSDSCTLPLGDGRPTPGFHLASFGTCAGPFQALPAGTPLRLELFPPAQEPPESLVGFGEACVVECQEPSDPMCEQMEEMLACNERRCDPAYAAYFACASIRCPGDDDFDSDCVTERCARELAETDTCAVSCWWMPNCETWATPMPESEAGVSN